jgi:hypothetical protein
LVEKVDLPIEGINWVAKPLDTGEKIGISEKRIRGLRSVILKMLKNKEFSKSDLTWPRTKIWNQSVKEFPKLFPDDPDDQRDGVFAKAYNILRKELS